MEGLIVSETLGVPGQILGFLLDFLPYKKGVCRKFIIQSSEVFSLLRSKRMAAAEEVKFCLRVMVNKEKTKVLFADVHSDFADVLISFLTLPLGTIPRLLKKHYGNQAPVLGSFKTLYNGLENLDNDHFWTKEGKLMLLNPRSAFGAECRKLKLKVGDNTPTKYFCCEDCCIPYVCISIYYGTMRCSCGKLMNKEVFMGETDTTAIAGDAGDSGAFFSMRYNFLIRDDLQMIPYTAGTMFETLSNLGILDTNGAEIRAVTVGFDWVMDLLRKALLSRTPLTDLILNNRQMGSATSTVTANCAREAGTKRRRTQKKMEINAMIQKSTNKLLFAQADDDFVDFLFSLLTIPLGAVASLLDGRLSLGSVDNLHRSIASFDGCLKTPDIKTKLLQSKLPHMYLSKNQILSLTEQIPESMYYRNSKLYNRKQCNEGGLVVWKDPLKEDGSYIGWKDPKGNGSYVKGPRMFMITDDLTVTPFFASSTCSTLNRLNIPLTDVEARKVDIGMEEGLAILNASLTSTTALTDALSSILKKQPKQKP